MTPDFIAIDVHTHINHGSRFDSRGWKVGMSISDLSWLKRMNEAAGIDKMICSTFASVMTTKVVEEENEYLFQLACEEENLYQWVVIDPCNANTFRQAERMLRNGKCVGIKLHPPMHKYKLYDYGDEIAAFASEREAIVLIHPEADADYILPLANKYPKVTFIMAHMEAVDYANAIEFAVNKNVYVDTSGSASTYNSGVEYVVDRVGSDRILFGTDTYAAGFQRGRIEYALIAEQDKQNILRYNAERLFAKYFQQITVS